MVDPIVETVLGAEIVEICSGLTGAVASSEAKGSTLLQSLRSSTR
jgi:hypothetical protein